jgi:hypothetical protein
MISKDGFIRFFVQAKFFDVEKELRQRGCFVKWKERVCKCLPVRRDHSEAVAFIFTRRRKGVKRFQELHGEVERILCVENQV